MIKNINLGNKKSAICILKGIKEKKTSPYDIRIRNSHILELNAIIGKRVFIKDALYINSETIWEIMQNDEMVGKHHHHGLTPENIYEALSTMRYSKNISISYDNRYVIVTLASIKEDLNLAVIVEPGGSLKDNAKANIIRIVTIYPYRR